MSEETGAPAGGEAITVVSAGSEAPAEFTMNHAAKALADIREKRNQPSAESAPEATAEPELSDEGNAAPAEEQATGETQEADPAEKPPLELPRSWTKDRAEVWNRLDPAAQEILLDQDRKASAEVRRVQNEAADIRKAAEAEREALSKERQQYEEKRAAPVTPVSLVEEKMRAEFGDLKNTRDLEIMQQEDPFRFQRWQFLQAEWAVANAEHQAVQQRQQQERQSKRTAYEAEQNKLLMDLVPEMAEPSKAAVLRERAIAMLNNDLGLSNDQLGRWMQDDTGHAILSNAGMQRLMADGLKYRDMLNAPKAVAKPNLPPVQRPGTSKPAGLAQSERAQALNLKPELSVNEAMELYKLRSSRRAS